MTFFSYFESLKDFFISFISSDTSFLGLSVVLFALVGQVLIIMYWFFRLNRMWNAQQTFFLLDQRIENSLQRLQIQLDTIIKAHRHHAKQIQEEQERIMLLKEELKILVERAEKFMILNTDMKIESFAKKNNQPQGGYRDHINFKKYGS